MSLRRTDTSAGFQNPFVLSVGTNVPESKDERQRTRDDPCPCSHRTAFEPYAELLFEVVWNAVHDAFASRDAKLAAPHVVDPARIGRLSSSVRDALEYPDFPIR